MKAKETQKKLGHDLKLSDKYQTLDALYGEKESQYQLFGKWKEKMDEIVKKPNQALRLKQIAIEGKMNEEALSFLPGSVLKRQILSGKYSIETLEDSAYAYFEDIHRELKLTYDAVTKKEYRKLVTLFIETLPNDLRQLIETNAIGTKNNDDKAKAIYIIQVEIKKKQYLEELLEAEKNNTELETINKIDDIRYALKLGRKINSMTYILIDHLLKRISNNPDDLNAYKNLVANTFDVDPNTITRYLDARLKGDPRNDPYKSKISLEYALGFFDKLKNKKLTEEIERHLNKL
jgi:hypothetical protein